jgi:hypothetical protein
VKLIKGVAAVTVCLSSSCGPSTRVALNERIFELPSMKSAGKGCVFYALGGAASSGASTGGANVSGLVVSQRSDGDHVLVEVTEGRRVLAERRYGEAFFRAGTVDDFIATGASGEGRRLRYWGAFDASGEPRCASFDDDGAR